MPYIDPDFRPDLLKGWELPKTPGDLNFVLTSEVLDYLRRNGEPKYADYNEAIGVLECMKLELYRRAVAPYEDSKIATNGDVY